MPTKADPREILVSVPRYLSVSWSSTCPPYPHSYHEHGLLPPKAPMMVQKVDYYLPLTLRRLMLKSL